MATLARSKVGQTTGSGELVGDACVVHGLSAVATATGGTVVLKDGGSGGTTIATFDTPAAAGHVFIPFAPNGIEFGTDCYATLTDVTACSVVYTDD